MGLGLAAGTLTDLTSLSSLDLASSGVWGLPAGELCNLQQLARLNLSHNSLQDLQDLGWGDQDCSLAARSLDLSHNSLSSVPPAGFRATPRLAVLLLAANSLQQIHDGALGGLGELRTLDLSGNKVVALPASLFSATPDLQQLR